MKDRIKLLIIITGLLFFLFIFQNYMDTFWAVVFLVIFMALYMVYTYFFTKHQRRKLKKNPPVLNKNFKPFISILIPCHNEETVIEKTVENILQVDWENYEIILIDDRSKDKTPEIIKKISEENSKVSYIIRPQEAYPGKSAVLNDALKIAKGEAILVFDADAKIGPDFIKKLLIKFEDKDVGAVQARKSIINYEQNFLTRCQYNEYVVDTHIQVSRDAIRGAVELRGNGELIKRKTLEDVGGWNNETITDDLDLSTKLHINGWDIRFCEDAVVYEEGVLTYPALIKQRRRWTEGSIRRYLEYMKDIFFSRDMSLRVGADLISYMTIFLLPFWTASEIIIQTGRIMKNGYTGYNSILSSIIVILCVGLLFCLYLFYSLRKYSHYSPLRRIYETVATSIYMIVFWVPIVFVIILKIIFTPKTMDWGKTQHGVTIENAKV